MAPFIIEEPEDIVRGAKIGPKIKELQNRIRALQERQAAEGKEAMEENNSGDKQIENPGNLDEAEASAPEQ